MYEDQKPIRPTRPTRGTAEDYDWERVCIESSPCGLHPLWKRPFIAIASIIASWNDGSVSARQLEKLADHSEELLALEKKRNIVGNTENR